MTNRIEPPWTAVDWSKIQRLLQILAALMEGLKTPEERMLASNNPEFSASLDWLKLLKALDWISKNGPDLMAKLQELVAIFSSPPPAPPEPAPTPSPVPPPGPAPQP